MRAGCRAREICAVVLVGLGALCAPRALHAQTEGEPLAANEFNIDLVIGPVLGAGRIIGIGGAYTALAFGVEGASWNPAAYASRGLWDIDWFEWDLTGSLVPGMVRNSDFDNNGESGFTYDEFIFGSLGGGLSFGDLGLGALLNIQSYNIGADTDLSLIVANYGAGYALAGGQLVLGAGARTVSLAITDTQSGDQLVQFAGTSPEVGALLCLPDQPFRVGAAARMPVESGRADTLVAAGLALPREVRLPWEVQLGFALQLGPRPLNRRFENPNDIEARLRTAMLARRAARAREQARSEQIDERLRLSQDRAPPTAELAASARPDQPRDPEWWQAEQRRRWDEERALLAEIAAREAARQRNVDELPRRYLLLSSELILVGPTDDGVGLESFLSQERQVSGRDTTVGVRFGVEGEPIQRWVKMRAGTYFEPSRFAGVGYRAHGTLGIDVRLFTWDLFDLIDDFTVRLGTSADVAERYLNLGIGLGIWH